MTMESDIGKQKSLEKNFDGRTRSENETAEMTAVIAREQVHWSVPMAIWLLRGHTQKFCAIASLAWETRKIQISLFIKLWEGNDSLHKRSRQSFLMQHYFLILKFMLIGAMQSQLSIEKHQEIGAGSADNQQKPEKTLDITIKRRNQHKFNQTPDIARQKRQLSKFKTRGN